jgi:UDP-N-acetylglucosamine 2-epimerase (non-hydrolysing)/GDP/UDP-N,N'-diacetylbacillosamine 2-epimerase (hydrolysing)
MPTRLRRICFVTGTRAEFGLMASTLRAIAAHPGLELQLIATGMHLDPAHGRTINDIRRAGFQVDATVPWKPRASLRDAAKQTHGDSATHLARQTGRAVAGLADAFAKLDPDVVLVVGDRVEAFAAATAAHLSGRVVAHAHGGDRALGQVDDALRHAITKLTHVHFPATRLSAERVAKMGEDRWRIFRVGSPGVDGIATDAWTPDQCVDLLHPMYWKVGHSRGNRRLSDVVGPYALVVLHPTSADDREERDRAEALLTASAAMPVAHRYVVYPNNDPGSRGIATIWDSLGGAKARPIHHGVSITWIRSLPRPAFLGLLRDAAVLIGNSSSGIIEAASFGTPVIDVGPRQAGRERGPNVTTVPFTSAAIRRALRRVWNDGRPVRYPKRNLYGAGDTAARLAATLAGISLDERLRRKLIAY